jgi:hypothetical protein
MPLVIMLLLLLRRRLLLLVQRRVPTGAAPWSRWTATSRPQVSHMGVEGGGCA